jgi:hypothetical protein
MELTETGCEDEEWIKLAQCRNLCVDLRQAHKVGNF